MEETNPSDDDNVTREEARKRSERMVWFYIYIYIYRMSVKKLWTGEKMAFGFDSIELLDVV